MGAQATRFNNVLQVLDLERVGISNSGAVAFARALVSNTALQVLAMPQNFITDKGAQALGHALLKNHCLLRLDLKSNGISDAGAETLAKAALSNQTLERVDLRCNSVSEEAMRRLEQTLRANSCLEKLLMRSHTQSATFASARQSIGEISEARHTESDEFATSLSQGLDVAGSQQREPTRDSRPDIVFSSPTTMRAGVQRFTTWPSIVETNRATLPSFGS